MQTGCTPNLFGFQDLGSRKVVAGFDGGMISSDAGGLLLREVAVTTDLLRQFSTCFLDYRNRRFVEHSVQDLVSQKVLGLCLGYEDVVDHDTLRFDPLFATLCGKGDPSGQNRTHARDKGKACAGESPGEIEVVKDFLPAPSELIYKEDTIRVTLGLSRRSVHFFKRQAKKYETQYQKMIRRLLDLYVDRQGA